MKNLFVYGTLMFDEVWQQLTVKKYHRTRAFLPHFQRVTIKNETYPAVFRSIKSTTDGVLIHNISGNDIRQLDRFEGKYYKRCSVTVYTHDNKTFPAEVYVIKNRFRKLLTSKEWQPEEFNNKHIDRFLSSYKNFHS